MAFLQFTNISLAFAERNILDNVSLYLKSGDKAALCGPNGAGKTTLLKVIAGEIEADAGQRSVEKGCSVSYLPQEGIVSAGKTLQEELDSCFDHHKETLRRLEDIRELLADSKQTGEGGQKTRSLLFEHDALFERLEESGYMRREKNISLVAKGLGFSEEDLSKLCEHFSGGWQMRIGLAKILLRKPAIMILDEPTNYLDIEARSWLLKWLKDFQGALLIVSHDRYFLDALVTFVFELFAGKLKRYSGNYSEYEKNKAADDAKCAALYKAQRAEIERLEKLVARFRYKASKAAFAQEQLKKLEKMERLNPVMYIKKIHIHFPDIPCNARAVLSLKDFSKSYGAFRVIDRFDLTLEAGERLVCAGVNGSGKSTLLRIIAGFDKEFGGKMRFASGVSAGYFSQDTPEKLRGPLSVLDYLKTRAPQENPSRLRDMLGSFLFQADDVYKSLDMLSGGEKSRLALLELLLQPYNLLILDEPTNHLDIYSKEALLNALQKWKGTCVFVSHDRAFMEALSTKTLELKAGCAPRLFSGNYRYYLEKTGYEQAAAAGLLTLPAAGPALEGTGTAQAFTPPFEPPPQSGAKRKSENALSRDIKKREQAHRRRMEREEQSVMDEIAALEAEKARLETELAKSEAYESGGQARTLLKELEKVKSEIAQAEALWERLSTLP